MTARQSSEGRASDPTTSPLDRLATALPGDVVVLREAGEQAIRTVLLCSETIAGQATQWQWIILDDGSLIELTPRGRFRYTRHRVLEQGTGPFEALAAQDGALVRFERRVRRGTVGTRPVRVTLDGRAYAIAFTGTVNALRLGPPPELAPWRAFDQEPTHNVYFGLIDPARADDVVLGLWTSHIALSFGTRLPNNEIVAVRDA